MSSIAAIQGASPSQAVVEAVAAREHVEPTDLTPLYESIDAEALDALVDSIDGGGPGFRIEFTYHGYDVTVDGDGVVQLDGVTCPPKGIA